MQASAQDNVADIAHAFIKSVKTNDVTHIQKHFITGKNAHKILPKTAVGLSGKEQNRKYIQPLHNRFKENFEKIQSQIKNGNIDANKIDLQSYKLEKIKNADKTKLQAMSLFFDYNGKERIIPISVVEIDEQWFILEILYVSDIFKKS